MINVCVLAGRWAIFSIECSIPAIQDGVQDGCHIVAFTQIFIIFLSHFIMWQTYGVFRIRESDFLFVDQLERLFHKENMTTERRHTFSNLTSKDFFMFVRIFKDTQLCLDCGPEATIWLTNYLGRKRSLAFAADHLPKRAENNLTTGVGPRYTAPHEKVCGYEGN